MEEYCCFNIDRTPFFEYICQNAFFKHALILQRTFYIRTELSVLLAPDSVFYHSMVPVKRQSIWNMEPEYVH